MQLGMGDARRSNMTLLYHVHFMVPIMVEVEARSAGRARLAAKRKLPKELQGIASGGIAILK